MPYPTLYAGYGGTLSSMPSTPAQIKAYGGDASGGLGALNPFGYGVPAPGSTPDALAGGPVTGYNSAYGGVPSVPPPGAAAGDSIEANLQNLLKAQELARLTNEFNLGQVTNQYTAGLPNYKNLVAQSSTNIGNNLRGVLPPDVLNLIGQTGAERGIDRGFAPGSPNTNAAYLRALGLTSLGLEQKGEDQLTGAIGRTPTTPIYNPANQFITPQQQYEAQLLANIYKSAPVPADKAAAELAALLAGRNQGTGPGHYGGGGGSPFANLGTRAAPPTATSPYYTPPVTNPIQPNPYAVATQSSYDPNALPDIFDPYWDEWANAGTTPSAGTGYNPNETPYGDTTPFYQDDPFFDPFSEYGDYSNYGG